jgi:hypothetical protein
MLIIFVMLSRMLPTLEFEFHECGTTSGILKRGDEVETLIKLLKHKSPGA